MSSTAAQVQVCKAICDRVGFHVVAEFADEAISGGTSDRPGYQALTASARARSFDVIVAEDTSRLWRNMGLMWLALKELQAKSLRELARQRGRVLGTGLRSPWSASDFKRPFADSNPAPATPISVKSNDTQKGRLLAAFFVIEAALYARSGGLLTAIRAKARQSVRDCIGCGNGSCFNDFDSTGQASTDEVENAGFCVLRIVGGDSQRRFEFFCRRFSQWPLR